jgi:hypothetical protein
MKGPAGLTQFVFGMGHNLSDQGTSARVEWVSIDMSQISWTYGRHDPNAAVCEVSILGAGRHN